MDDFPYLLCPQFRVEHRVTDQSSLIVAYADSVPVSRSRARRARNNLLLAHIPGKVVVVDQDTDQVVASYDLPAA